MRLSAGLLASLIVLSLLSPLLAQTTTCPKCGAAVEPGALFCTRCGTKLGPTPAPSATPGAPPDPRLSVVQVLAVHDQELTSLYTSFVYGSHVQVESIVGSAFAITPGEFVTDAGLISGAKEITLRPVSGGSAPAKVLGVDPLIGVALLAADLPEIPPLIERTGAARTGDGVSALGFPSGRQTARAVIRETGILSGLHRGGAGIHPIEDYLQIDVAIPSGFAGGPVVDTGGGLVGMSTASIFAGMETMGPQVGIGLVIPTAWIDRAMTWVRGGSPPRPWIGIRAVAAEPVDLKTYGLGPEVRLIIDQVFPGSPAEKAGLGRGDGLVRAHGETIPAITPLQEWLLRARPGDTLTIETARRERRQSVPVVLAARPDRPLVSGLEAIRLYGGMEIAPKDDTTLAVSRVLPGSLAAKEKMERGEILQEVYIKKDLQHAQRDTARWRPVRTVDEVEKLLRYAYSDLDFLVLLRFKTRDGRKREMVLGGPLTATDAL